MESSNKQSVAVSPTRGVVYDTGMAIGAVRTRAVFDPDLAGRELAIIARDLGADAVRIIGDQPDRLVVAAELAHAEGLKVWLSPFPYNLNRAELAGLLTDAAGRAEELRGRGIDVVLVLGCEHTLYSTGLLPGATLFDRSPLLSEPGSHAIERANELARGVHQETTGMARKVFGGPVTYAAGLWEQVDWDLYDRVSVNAYRDAGNLASYPQILRAYRRWGKPVSVTEFGCCTYTGAAERGPAGFLVLDATTDPPRITPGIARDEHEQARYFTDTWDILVAEGVEDAFWFTFAGYALPHRLNSPPDDLDLASFGLVAISDQPTEAYPDMPWRPKAAFEAVRSAFLTRHTRRGP